MRPLLGYIRVSTDEQADSGLGLVAQRQRIEAYATIKDLPLAEVFEEAGVSGGKLLSERPAGKRLLARAKRERGIVVVAKLDRLFRSVADAAQTIAAFDSCGVELVAIAEGFDMTSPYGRAMAQMASVFAELERAMIAERTRAALKVKRSRGERISRHAPFGWDFEGGKLVENGEQQRTLAQIRGLRDEGFSLRQIAELLNERNVKPKKGKAWSHSTVVRILGR